MTAAELHAQRQPNVPRRHLTGAMRAAVLTIAITLALYRPLPRACAADRDTPGFGGQIDASFDDVVQAASEVAHDQIIHGTYMYEKDKTLTGAAAVDSTPLFDAYRGEGKAFYKIRKDVLAPRHFVDSADQGTIAVRYIVTRVDEEHTRVKIDAIFVEYDHHGKPPSDGTVETTEFKIIQEHVQAIQGTRQEALDVQKTRDNIERTTEIEIRRREEETTRLTTAESSARDLEQRVDALRRQVEMRVKAPGAGLKSAPFHSAADVAPLAAFTDVVIVIITPRWYGVETPSGQRGWLPIDQLEALP